MIELPESANISEQIAGSMMGKTMINIVAGDAPHKFTFYFRDKDNYQDLLNGRRITGARPNAGQVEVQVEEMRLVFTDGANLRYYYPGEKQPKKHQLFIEFDDNTVLICTIQMYGGIWAFREGENDHSFYLVARDKPSPLSEKFDEPYFESIVAAADKKISVKALLATEQRIPGLGNGVLQDILFNAGVNPQTKLTHISDNALEKLFVSVKQTLFNMTVNGGRNTEKDIFGAWGGYKTLLSNKTYKNPCPHCSGEIIKKTYMGGTVYFCPQCQPLKK